MSNGQSAEAMDGAIAVVGMAGRFPGARNPDQYWRNIRDAVESIQSYTDDQLREAGVSDALLADPAYVRRGAELPDMELFDAALFGFNPKDAAIMDPQHRHFLECSWAAFEDAGHAPTSFDGAIGVFAGSGMHSYMLYHLAPDQRLMDSVGFFLVRHTGNDKDFLATRVSYELNLTGPSVNVQTACSTSLVAVHMGCQSLLNGECDLALAGGSTIELPHRTGYMYEEGEILAPDGHCRPFDVHSQGTVFGSGVGAVVLRRYADAVADGDHIHAVILGSAINNDGSSKVGYLAPSVDGQAQVVAEALEVAGADPESIGFIEAHGTGTAIGDPIEVAALIQAYRARTDKSGYCAIGSVKSNIGHVDTAAGIASMIKAIQALKHRQIPPTLHYTAPNPQIDFASSPFFVNADLREWEAGGEPRRAGVTSLGVGGTNAHLILEEAPAATPSSASRAWQLLMLSARTPTALDALTTDLADHLSEHRDLELPDVAFTLQQGRTLLPHRRIAVCRGTADAASTLDALDASRVVTAETPSSTPALTFLFAGGGAQYPGMGRELYETEPVYRDAIDECLRLVAEQLDFDLEALLYPAVDGIEPAAAELERPSRALPALFATQYAQAQLWMSWGVSPTAMIGHSMGEYTAACLAGVFTLKDALALVALRGRLFETVPEGAMLSVSLPADELEPLLGEGVSVAAVNAPTLCVASGPVDAIVRLETRLADQGVDCQRVHIKVAAHSAMLEGILDEFRAYVRTLELHPPQLPFVSNMTGEWVSADLVTDPEYWVRHLRQTVRFSDGVAVLLERPGVFLEVGPGRTLTSLTQMHPSWDADRPTMTSLRHPDDETSDQAFVLTTLGRLWQSGIAIAWSAFWGDEDRRRLPLPTYPFEHQHHWIDRPTESSDVGEDVGRRPDRADWFYQPAWRKTLVPVTTDVAAGSRLLVFAADAALDAQIIAEARAAGWDPTVVRPGEAFAQTETGGYELRPTAPEDYRALFESMAKAEALPAAVLHLWLLDDRVAGGGLVDRGFTSLLNLGQALGSRGTSDPIAVIVASQTLHQLAGESVRSPEQALALGPCHVIPREIPGVSCRSVDLDAPPGASWQEGEMVRRLVGELRHDAGPSVVAYRGADRFARSFDPVSLGPAAEATEAVRERGVYLITGGLGGLGMALARHLAGRARARLVLIGRSPFPARDTWDEWLAAHAAASRTSAAIAAVRDLEAMGAEVVIAQADVTDPDRMAAVVGETIERFGTIHGVLHAAGVLDDGLLELKTPDEAARVLAPKVAGTRVLDEVTRDHELDFFVVYSSISSLIGPAGQIDYSAANAFLDAFAHYRRDRTGQATYAVNWPAWRDVGMAAELLAPGTADGRSDPESDARPVAHPLLDTCVAESDGEVRFSTRFTAADHWILDEHRLRDGLALIPGAGYLELARAAFQADGTDGPVELHDVFFVAPFMVPDDSPKELQVRLKKNGRGTEFVITSPAENGDGTQSSQEHVRGVVGTTVRAFDTKHAIDEIRDRCAVRTETFDGPQEHPHLRFGRRWASLKRIDYGASEALATLELDAELGGDLDDYKLHPALLDVATAGAQSLIADFDPTTDFYVPVGYGRLTFCGNLPATLFSHVRYRQPEDGGRDIAVFDVTVFDGDGTECIAIEEFTMQRVGDSAVIGQGAGSAAPGAATDPSQAAREALERVLAFGVESAEGLDALTRILAAGCGPQVVVSPFPLADLIAELGQPVTHGTSKPAPTLETRDDDPELGDVETVLEGHEDIAAAVIVRRFDRPGEARLTAYVVPTRDAEATVSELRRFVKRNAAEHVVPRNFVELDELPRTDSGAVDYEALPDPFAPVDQYVAPRTDMERLLARIWCDVLGVDRVSAHDNFFDIGGHSLLSIRVITRLNKETGVHLSVAIMVLHTLEQIAKECEQRLGGDQPASNEVASARAGAVA